MPEIDAALQILLDVRSAPEELAPPSLRNLGATAPFMHNGHFATLEEVVDFYRRFSRGGRGGRNGPTLNPMVGRDQIDPLARRLTRARADLHPIELRPSAG